MTKQEKEFNEALVQELEKNLNKIYKKHFNKKRA